MLDLKRRFEDQNRQARFEEVKGIQYRHELFKGNQNIYWNERDNRWLPITSNGVSTIAPDDEDLRYDYVTNIYGPNCMIDAAILCANAPSYEFGPKDPRDESDLATAKAADELAEFISDNNRLDLKQIDMAFFNFNDAGCGSFTRFEIDPNKYGTTPNPIIQPVPKKLPDALKCAQCGWQQELPDAWQQDISQVPQACPQCGMPITPESVQPGPTTMVPEVVAVEQIPNGQEVISYVGYLELERPFYAKNQDEFPWIRWDTEVPKSKLKAMFPEIAEKIQVTEGEGNTIAARQARLSLQSTVYGRKFENAANTLVTFTRLWLRPWAFYELDDKNQTQSLIQRFPEGAYVAFCGDLVAETKSENMDDMWVVTHAMPGDGQIRSCTGKWMEDIQKRYNTEQNIMTETFERGISTRFVDTDVVDVDAYQKSGALPGSIMGGQARPGSSMGDAFYDTPQPQVSEQMVNHGEELMGRTSQFITSNQPEVFGGDTGSNDTASGIKTVKDSAMGVKALYKQPMNEFHAATMMNAIKCLQKNRKNDVVMSIEGEDGEFDAKIIRLDEIKGNIVVRTDVSSAYPMSLAAQREMVSGMLASPVWQPLLMAPQNTEMLKQKLGAKSLVFPNEDARQRQKRAIRLMSQGQAVLVNPLMDNHQVCVAVNKEWWDSDEGQKSVLSGEATAMLVEQNTMEHLMASAQQQAPGPQDQPPVDPNAPQPAAPATN